MEHHDENARFAFEDDNDEYEEDADGMPDDEGCTVFADDCDAHLLDQSSDSDDIFIETGGNLSSSSASGSEDLTATPTPSFISSFSSEPQAEEVTQLIGSKELEENFSKCSTNVINATVSQRTSMLWMVTAPSVRDMRYVLVPKEHKDDPYVANLVRDPKTTVFFSVVKLEIMYSCMNNREYFGQFDLSTPSGNASATLLSLFGEAFSSPAIGSLVYSSTSGGMFTQTGCHTFELHGERHSKGVVFFEMLCRDDHGLPDMDVSEQSKHIHKFYGQFNSVIGYRMVVGFCDPEIKPDDAIRRRIVENSRLAGVALPHVKIDINSANSKDILNEKFEGDMEKFAEFVDKHNKRVESCNTANAKLAEAAKDWKPTKPEHYHRQVTDYYKYFALGIVPFYEFQDVDAGHAMTAVLSTTDPNDQVVQGVTGCHANFSIKNKDAVERLQEYGVCESQNTMASYLFPLEDAPTYIKAEELRFPMKSLVFCTSFLPHIKPNVLMNLQFPWAIHPIEIALESQRDLVKHRQKSTYKERDLQMLEHMDPEGVQYFAQMSQVNDYEHDKMVQHQVRRQNDTSEVNDLYYTKTLGGVKMPTSESSKEEDNNVFRVKMPIEEAIEKHLGWFEEIERCAPSMTEEARLTCMELLRQSGGLLLQSVCNIQNKNELPMVKSAISLLRGKEQRQETMYHEMVTSFDEFGVFGSYMAEMLLVLTDIVGLTNNVDVANDVRINALRVVWSHTIERYFGDSGDKPSHLFYGAPASGKTHTGDVLARDCWLPGTKEDSMTSSERANNTFSARGGVIYKDEADATIDPSLASTPVAQAQLAQTKSAMTNHEVSHSFLTINQDARGKDQVHNRKIAHLITPYPAVRLASVNRRKIGNEPSFATRWLVDYWKHEVDAGNKLRLLNAVMPVTDGTRAQDPKKSALLFFREMFHKEQAWHTLIALAISTGKLPYPNTQMLRVYWHVIANEMVDIIPTFLTNIRASGTYLESYAKALCVTTAVQIMFRETSPLASFNASTGQTTARPFDLEQVGLVKPYLFLHESAAIFAITRYVHRYILPSEWYIVADAIAREFCQFYGSGDAPVGNRPAFDTQTTAHGEVEVLSVVRATMTWQTLISRVCALTGHTHQTAEEVIELLQTARIKTPWVYSDPKNNESDGASWNGETREIPFMTLQRNETSFSKTVTIFISTYYLIEMSPSKVMARMLRTISHRGIRSRQVMLGVANPKMPSTFLTARLGPGKHVLRVPKSCMMNKNKQAMFFDSGLTAEKRSIMPDVGGNMQVTNSEVVFDGDVETMLYDKWAASIGITDPDERAMRCPKNIDADIRYKHQTFPNYREKIIKRYPQDLQDPARNASSSSLSKVATRPGEVRSEAPRSKNSQVIRKIWDGKNAFVRAMGVIDQSTTSDEPISFTTTTDTVQLAQFSRSTTTSSSSVSIPSFSSTTTSSSSSISPLDKIRGVANGGNQETRKRTSGSSLSSVKKRTPAKRIDNNAPPPEHAEQPMSFFNIITQ